MKNYFIILLLLFSYCKDSVEHKIAKVTEPQGLILRDRPNTEGKKLALMNQNEEVIVLNESGPEETLYKIKANWFEVEYKGQKGWAFGGFLEYRNKISENQSTIRLEEDTKTVVKKIPISEEKRTFTNSIEIEFVLISPGEFMMGCVKKDKDCSNEEIPQHRITITNPFYLGKYEVTQGQWKKIMGTNPSYFKNCGDNCPVEQVSWNDIQEFIKKLNVKEGKKYRLPTEAEWEYAARAGTTTIYYWGNEMNSDYVWYSENSGGETHPVGQKKPNAYGLYDMSGNVWEWVEDWFSGSYYNDSPANDPKGPWKGSTKICRGGSSNFSDYGTRLSSRVSDSPKGKSKLLGFRLVSDY